MTQKISSTTEPKESDKLVRLVLETYGQITSMLHLDDLLPRIGEIVKRVVDYEIFAILILNEKTQELSVRFSVGHPKEVVRSLRIPLGEGIVGCAAETGRPVLVNNVLEERAYIPSLESVRSELAIPLIAKGTTIGVMNLEAVLQGYFSEQVQHFLTLLAAPMAIAIENARLYERVPQQEERLHRDLTRAQQIQQFIMPTPFPMIQGLEVGVHFRPARELGGDLYEFIFQPDRTTAIVIGDVSGKGAPAALYGAMATGILRSFSSQLLIPAEMLLQLNQLLLQRQIEGHFLTLCYTLWELERRCLKIASQCRHAAARPHPRRRGFHASSGRNPLGTAGGDVLRGANRGTLRRRPPLLLQRRHQ